MPKTVMGKGKQHKIAGVKRQCGNVVVRRKGIGFMTTGSLSDSNRILYSHSDRHYQFIRRQ